MKQPHTCGLCEKEMNETNVDAPVCNECLDILEFGYPSFPAYRLAESDGLERSTSQENLIDHLQHK